MMDLLVGSVESANNQMQDARRVVEWIAYRSRFTPINDWLDHL